MKKLSLPISESFTVHATALVYKVHQQEFLQKRDSQKAMILNARNRTFSLRQADEKVLDSYFVR